MLSRSLVLATACALCAGCAAPAQPPPDAALSRDNPASPDAASVAFVRPPNVLAQGDAPAGAPAAAPPALPPGAMQGMQMPGMAMPGPQK